MTASAERRDLDMRGITAVEVATFGGELSVVTGADHPRMEATTFGNATYSVERVGSLLYIVGKKRGFFYFGNGVGFRLWLPGDLALRLANVSADIRVRGDLRTLSVNVVHGGVELRASNLDEAKLRAVHGRVVAHGVTGKLDITATPGEVRVINSGGELHISATPGNVRLEQVMLAPGTSHDVTASPGDIEIVGIHAPGGLELNGSTTHPPITADLPGYDDVYHKKRSLYARRPGPRRAKLTLHASGSLSIKG